MNQKCYPSASCAPNQILIIKGQSKVLDVQFIDTNGKPVNMSGFQSSRACFPRDGGGVVQVAGVLISSDLGLIRYSLLEDDTALLKRGEEQTIEFEAKTTTATHITQAVEGLEVRERICPEL